MAKRRILEKLKMTEISGVDRPCQQGALVTIMKRDPTAGSDDAVAVRIQKLQHKAQGIKAVHTINTLVAELDRLIAQTKPSTAGVMKRANAAIKKAKETTS